MKHFYKAIILTLGVAFVGTASGQNYHPGDTTILHNIKMNNFIQYIKDSFEELSTNMTWATREEAQKSTVIVAVFTIVFALLVAGIDKVFQTALDNFFKFF